MRHARACPGHPRRPRSDSGRRIGLYRHEPGERHALYRRDERSGAANLRASPGADRGVHETARPEAPRLLRAFRRHPRRNPAREDDEALVARVEGRADTRPKPRMGGPLRHTGVRLLPLPDVDARDKPGHDDDGARVEATVHSCDKHGHDEQEKVEPLLLVVGLAAVQHALQRLEMVHVGPLAIVDRGRLHLLAHVVDGRLLDHLALLAGPHGV